MAEIIFVGHIPSNRLVLAIWHVRHLGGRGIRLTLEACFTSYREFLDPIVGSSGFGAIWRGLNSQTDHLYTAFMLVNFLSYTTFMTRQIKPNNIYI